MDIRLNRTFLSLIWNTMGVKKQAPDLIPRANNNGIRLQILWHLLNEDFHQPSQIEINQKLKI